MSSVESSTSTSLLIPPNPSLSSTKPSASILLNGTGRAPTAIPTPASPPRSTTPQLTSYSSSSTYSSYASSFAPSSPAASASSSRSAHGSFSSTTSTSSIPFSTQTRPTPIRRGSTPKISFAPLPEIPVELKRRNSITIGVASRKNLLTGQGSAAGGEGPRGTHKVMMTDQEWEDYKRHFEEKNGANDVVDLGAVAKQGAKALWGKMKRGRSPSTSSTTSSVASSSTTSVTSSSATGPNPTPPLVPNTSSPAKPAAGVSLGTVTEEEQGEEVSPTTSTLGTFPSPAPASTRRPRSSSSPPPLGHGIGRSSSGAGLHIIPGSPPPSSKSKALYGDGDGDGANLSPATTLSTVSDNDIDNDTETDTESETEDPEGERQAEAEAESDPHDAGVRAAEASLHHTHKLLDHLHLDSSDEGEGDITPRRIPSPPPRKAELAPLVEEEALSDEAALSDEEDEGADGAKTPSGLSENGWANKGKTFTSGDNAQGRHERAEVLGFDPERFGRALDIAARRAM
ncbi:hypothetical protein IAT40_003009 [Kwoniella sp. CBS 6097]